MNIIFDKRRTGKTTELIKLSAETGHYIVTLNNLTANDILNKAKKMNLTIPNPLTYHEFINCSYYGKNINGFLIDDAEMLLQGMSSYKIHTITMTDKQEVNTDYDLIVDKPLNKDGNPFNKTKEKMFLVDDLNKLETESKYLKDKLFDLEYRQNVFKNYIQNIYDDLMESNRINGYNYPETISKHIYRHILELINAKY